VLGVPGVVINDVRAERHFATGLGDELAHLERHRAGELVHARAQDGGGFCGYGCTLGERRAPPSLEAGGGGFKRLLKLLVGEFLERLQDFAVIGVDTLVGGPNLPARNF